MRRGFVAFAAIISIAILGCEQSVLDANTSSNHSDAASLSAAGTTNSTATSEYTAHHPSQFVECQIVDKAIAKIPQGDGLPPVTESETGPGGWRFNAAGRSFVTFNYDWDGAQYVSVAGRSRTGTNSTIVNDYPQFLDLPQESEDDQLVFSDNHGEIVLTGGDEFQLPGQDNGEVRINMQFTGTDNSERLYEGCAKTPQLTNFGFTVKEGGDFVQQEYFKAWARTDADGNVLEYEWTEISTFNNTDPEGT